MTVNAKRLILLLAVAFVLYFVIAQPQGSANVVQGILGALQSAASSIATFLRSLFNA